MDQAWRTTASRTILKDKWVDLRADHCVTPAGVDINPYYVLDYPEWVHVVAVTMDDRIVLVRQYRHAAGLYTMELPGGAADPTDADLEQTARRELEEETGFTAATWSLITRLYPNPATHTNHVHFYLALDAVLTRPQILDPGEEGLTVEVLPIQTILDGLNMGLLANAAHVSGLLLGLSAAGRLTMAAK